MKLSRRTLAVDPPGASRTSASASLNPLREIHNHHQHQHQQRPPHKQPRILSSSSHHSNAAVAALSASSSSSEGKLHRHRRHLQQQQLADKTSPLVHHHHRHHHRSRSHHHQAIPQSQTEQKQKKKQQQHKRKVRFVQNHKNQRITATFTIAPQDYPMLWYSGADIRAFQRAAKESIRPMHPHYHVWAQTLHRIYHAFLALDDAHKIMTILEDTPSQDIFHEAGLGMERRAVALVAEDAPSRRRQLLAAVHRCQTAPVPDPWLRAQMMREMCRTVSKPSRLYARHVAHMTAVAD